MSLARFTLLLSVQTRSAAQMDRRCALCVFGADRRFRKEDHIYVSFEQASL